jgi:acetyl esterase/lipase
MTGRTGGLLLARCVALFVALASVPGFAADLPADVVFEQDVVYGKGGDTDLKLDLARPKDAQGRKLPCVLVIHGGGWAQGNKSAHSDIIWKFAQSGYVSASIGYRLAPNHRFPAQVNDVKCAVRFLRASADKYGLDPQRIGAVGFSAGGHLSMMLGTTDKDDSLEGDGGSPEQSSRVQAVVSYFGPTDLAATDVPESVRGILKTFIGGTAVEMPRAYRQASPITYVSPGDAPMLLFQGTRDPLVPHTQAYAMIEAMTRYGIAGRVELLINASHGWGGDDLKHTADATFAFFDRHLKSKDRSARSGPAGGAAAGSAGR